MNIKNIQIHCVNILNTFSIYFKTSKLVVISVLWKHNRETKEQNPTDNPNSPNPKSATA